MSTTDCARRTILAGLAALPLAGLAATPAAAATPGTEAYEDARSRDGLPIPYALESGRTYISGGALRLDSRRTGRGRIYWHTNGAHRTYNFVQGDWEIRPGGNRAGQEYRGVLWLPMIQHRSVVSVTVADDESTPLSFRAGVSGGVTGLNVYFTTLGGQAIDLSTTAGLDLVLSASRNLWITVTSVGPVSNP